MDPDDAGKWFLLVSQEIEKGHHASRGCLEPWMPGQTEGNEKVKISKQDSGNWYLET